MEHLEPLEEIPEYVPHDGTLRISGKTLPRKAGNCAYFFLERGMEKIDFFCIGANANQQAMKAMGVFLFLVRRNTPKVSVAFQPIRHKTNTHHDGQVDVVKDCTVWRTVIFSPETPNDTKNSPKPH